MRCSALVLGALLLGWFPLTDSAGAAPLLVVEARGGGLRPGMRVESTTNLNLQEGERIVLIAPDGRTITLRGRYSGRAAPGTAATQNPRAALAALLTTRRDRASTIGAVRSGAVAAPLPDPWLIDMSRPGERCIRDGERPVWWRPEGGSPRSFTVFPLDRTWRADFTWQAGSSTMVAPDLAMLASAQTFVVRRDGIAHAIRVNAIPAGVDDPLLVAAWMLQKGCIQQADAYLRQLEAATAQSDRSEGFSPQGEQTGAQP